MFRELVLILILNLSFNCNVLDRFKIDYWDRIISMKYECKHDFLAYIIRNIDISDDPENFFCGKYTINLNEYPITGDVATKPWSGNYWPIKFGGLSARYKDNEKTLCIYSMNLLVIL